MHQSPAWVSSARHWFPVLALALGSAACSAYDPTLVGPTDQENVDTTDGGNSNAGSSGGAAGSGGMGGQGGGGAGGSGGMGGEGGGDGGMDSGPLDEVDGSSCYPNPDTNNQVCPLICPESCNNQDDDCDRKIDEGSASEDCQLENATALCIRGVCKISECMGTFRDCDGKDDTGCETHENDVKHCGTCGNSCENDFTNGVPACVDGKCVRNGCVAGWDNCDGDNSDCERNANTATDCGGCDVTCTTLDNATAMCVDTVCRPQSCFEGFGDCDSNPNNGCEESTNITVEHCGDCDLPCDDPGATELECLGGECLSKKCDRDLGYAECTGSLTDGCEFLSSKDHCGACNKKCDELSLANVSETSCDDETCVVEDCDDDYGNCDDDAFTGCETLLTNNSHCGECDKPCTMPNGIGDCSSGTCALSGCNDTHLDCNDSPTDGCEASKNDDDTCGDCDTQCLDNEVCSGGQCTTIDCSLPANADDCGGTACADCDLDGADCEIDIATDADHCGQCNSPCDTSMVQHATIDCMASQCKATCAPGYGDCNGDYKDGCEVELNTLDNCNGCDVTCAIPNADAVCTRWNGSAFVCEPAACAGNFRDCDTDPLTCETAINTTDACGDCNAACDLPNANEACTGGTGNWACSISTCTQSYYDDCNDTPSDGCEVDKRSDDENCGACGHDCADDANAASGACQDGLCNYNCDTGYDDCNIIVGDGCETDIRTTQNCGTCGAMCAKPNALAECSTGTCLMVPMSCQGAFADCNSSGADGCETPLRTTTDCTGCGVPCTVVNGTGTCTTGTCQRASCSVGWDNCDANPLDCERNTATLGPCLPDAGCVKATHGGRDYFFCPMAKTWGNALAACMSQAGGSLVQIDDMAENDFVKNNVGVADAWIGASDAAVEGAWRWQDGTQFWSGTAGGSSPGMLYENWNTGEPNESGGQDCGVFYGSASAPWGTWDDLGCTQTRAFVCEIQGDLCPDDPKNSPGQCGCAVADTDTDSDGAADCIDECDNDPLKVLQGQCACGTPNSDSDSDGTANCNDVCPNDPLKIADDGDCGCGVAETDTDGDLVKDCLDGCPNDGTRTMAPCGFPYTPSNFNPNTLTFSGNITCSANSTVTSADSTAAVSVCGVSVTPVIQTQTSGPKLFILPLLSLTVNSGVTLKLNGALPVVLAVQGSATISGTIDAGSVGAATLGAGANVTCSPGAGGNGATGHGNGGGGGGGYGLAGNAGGAGGGTYSDSGGSGGTAGGIGGAANVQPLRGGCAGGRNGGGSGTGGYGGGAVQLSTGGTLAVSSTAVVSAGGGGAPAAGGGAGAGGKGGGSGGSVLLESLTLSIHPDAWITANGGGGGSGNSSSPGSDGLKNSTAQAPGGTGGASGGKGGAATGAATIGANGAFAGAWINAAGGGGGGGGVGRIRLHQINLGCGTANLARTSPAVGVVCP
jgi:hypothetical protein